MAGSVDVQALQLLQNRLAKYLEAEERILLAQSYGRRGAQLSRASLADVREQIERLQNQIAALTVVPTHNQAVFILDP